MYKIPEILWQKTKRNVLKTLKIYNYYSLSLFDENTLKISEDYKIEISQIKTSKEVMCERLDFVVKVISSYNKLNSTDKEIIYKSYISSHKVNDDIIANKLGFSVKYYYKIKKEAIIKFAFALGVEALKGDDKG